MIETLRDAVRQEHYISTGVSWTRNSKHLPQPPNGLALAFDLAPKAYLKLKGWAPGAPLWLQLGAIGMPLGLTWGGGWSTTKDYPHWELPQCRC